ncbi:hypothetical protein HOL24_09255 [bacterium]|jgi:hypothetical protein|nr:hypothetical protein [bacterium]
MKFRKKNQLSSELLVVDGMWGVGKSIVTELISVFDSMESWSMDLSFDHIPLLYGEKTIREDAAITLIRNLFDITTYNMSISRSINFRYKDHTSIFKHPKKYDYIFRLLEQGGEDSCKKIVENRMIIPIATHMALSNNDLFLKALGKRCKIIRCVRHPLFMIDHWASYIDRCQTDPIEFNLKIDYKGENIPFFAKGWEDEYLKANNFEKSIKSIVVLTENYKHNFAKIRKKHGDKSVLEISFEDVVKNTDHVISLIATFIGRSVNNKTYKRVKKKQFLPRNTIDSGSGYISKEWSNNKEKKSEKESLSQNLDLIKNNVRRKYYEDLIKLINDYENKWINGC